jgi:hypothetical protein
MSPFWVVTLRYDLRWVKLEGRGILSNMSRTPLGCDGVRYGGHT